jgi:hypothetical protein
MDKTDPGSRFNRSGSQKPTLKAWKKIAEESLIKKNRKAPEQSGQNTM